ncbi:hypothetical protein VNO78_12571 [Psophocarpus tetragonolobus]|uniref:Uncharacterized protein n=1 Tax=Psophocarpus tetragonolobus TaxID=3891 RepID=A0AAN9SR78_PSOTE
MHDERVNMMKGSQRTLVKGSMRAQRRITIANPIPNSYFFFSSALSLHAFPSDLRCSNLVWLKLPFLGFVTVQVLQ